MPPRRRSFRTLPEYPLATIPQKKRELAARGVDVIDLGAGDADLRRRPRRSRRCEGGAQPAMSRYGFGLGLVPFREAVAAWMTKRFGSRFDPFTEIVPLIGSKEGISHLAFAYIEPGRVRDHPRAGLQRVPGRHAARRAASRIAIRCGRAPTSSSSSTRSRDDVLRRTRILYLNYPNNPTAAIAPRDYLERVVARVPRARHPARLRQRVLRARVRRLCAAEHLRDRRRARRGDRVPLALQDVQHDGLALRLGGGDARRSRARCAR